MLCEPFLEIIGWRRTVGSGSSVLRSFEFGTGHELLSVVDVLGVSIHGIAYVVFENDLVFRAFHTQILHLSFEILHLRGDIFDKDLVGLPISLFVIPNAVLVSVFSLTFLVYESQEFRGIICKAGCRGG